MPEARLSPDADALTEGERVLVKVLATAIVRKVRGVQREQPEEGAAGGASTPPAAV